MKKNAPRRRRRAPALLAGATLVGGALVALTLTLSGEEPPKGQVAAPAPQIGLPKRPLTPLEFAATRRFPAQPKVRLPDGTLTDPVNEENALALKVMVFQGSLAQDAQKRDPTFRLRAEAKLEEQRPAVASIAWEDLSGNRETVFTLRDRAGCGVADKDGELELSLDEIAKYPCLDRENLWDPGTKLTVVLEPIGREDRQWPELLEETMRDMAAEAYLAQASTGAEK